MRNSDRGGRLEHWLWLSGLVLWLATLSLPAGATDELVADRTLLIEPTEGFCALDLSNPVDSSLFEYMANLQKDYNQLVGYWVDCQQLERVRSRETETLESYVLVLAQRQETGAVIRPVDMPLGGFLSAMKDFILNSGGMGKIEEGYELGKDVLDDQGINLGETRSLGLIADDASALYLGNVQGYELNGVTAVMACVIAMTELNGIMISVNVYETYRGAETIELLQRRAATIAADLVVKNPTVVN